MQREQLVAVAIRVFAIFIVIYTIRYGASLLPIIESSDPVSASRAFFGFSVVPPLLAAAILWLFPLSLARGLLPKVSAFEPNGALGAGDIQVVALAVLGVWVLGSAIPDVFYWVIFIYFTNKSGIGPLTPERMGNVAATIVELGVGFGLLFGARGISGIIKLARTAGAKA